MKAAQFPSNFNLGVRLEKEELFRKNGKFVLFYLSIDDLTQNFCQTYHILDTTENSTFIQVRIFPFFSYWEISQLIPSSSIEIIELLTFLLSYLFKVMTSRTLGSLYASDSADDVYSLLIRRTVFNERTLSAAFEKVKSRSFSFPLSHPLIDLNTGLDSAYLVVVDVDPVRIRLVSIPH